MISDYASLCLQPWQWPPRLRRNLSLTASLLLATSLILWHSRASRIDVLTAAKVLQIEPNVHNIHGRLNTSELQHTGYAKQPPGPSIHNVGSYTQYVKPFMGTEEGGNMFPGATRPFGAIKMGPDVYRDSNASSDAYSGYLESGNITGFSMLHTSGTGGAPKYGVVAQLPLLGLINEPFGDLAQPRARPDEAVVGHYRSYLESGIVVDMASADHAGLYRYSYPGNANISVLVNLAHVLPSFRKKGLAQEYKAGSLFVHPNISYEGSAVYSNGWNRSPDWEIFFCGRFDQPFENVNLTCLDIAQNITQHCGDPGETSSKREIAATFEFGPEQILHSAVGVSWISRARACQYLESEIPVSTSIESLARDTQRIWDEQILSKVKVQGAIPEDLGLLYSSLYAMNIMPTWRTGENPKWKSNEPYFDDIIALWDTHRCTTALMQLLVPNVYINFIRSLVDTWRHDGYMPDARSSNYNGRTQVGSSADVVLADAYVKGVQFEWHDGYKAMLADAEIPPLNNSDAHAAPDNSSTMEGRGALPDWIAKGFISTGYARSVSRAAEYSYNDFALHQVAKGLSLAEDATKFLNRSRNWRHHWNPEASALNFTGFMVPMEANGSFVEQNPLRCEHCYWENDYYQALPYAYSLVPALHDAATLIGYCGGPEKFVARLEAMFVSNTTDPRQGSRTQSIFDPGNEPSFAVPYLFNYVGRQDLSVKYSRMVARQYGTSANGLPGNSDSGALQSWLLWNMIGLYPVTGTTTFLIGSPWFKCLEIDLGDGKIFRIVKQFAKARYRDRRPGLRGDSALLSDSAETASYQEDYVQRLTVNGEDWDRSWVTWDEVFAQGGTMEFVCGPQPRKWATGPLPPSPASE